MKNELVCYCKKVAKATVIRAIRRGATTLSAIQKTTGAGTGNRCKELNPRGRCCSTDIIKLIEDTVGDTDRKDCMCSCTGSKKTIRKSRRSDRKEG